MFGRGVLVMARSLITCKNLQAGPSSILGETSNVKLWSVQLLEGYSLVVKESSVLSGRSVGIHSSAL